MIQAAEIATRNRAGIHALEIVHETRLGAVRQNRMSGTANRLATFWTGGIMIIQPRGPYRERVKFGVTAFSYIQIRIVTIVANAKKRIVRAYAMSPFGS